MADLTLTVSVLRELFRHLQGWRSLYESDGVDVLQGPDGTSYALWDIEAVYELTEILPPRQREAIELCLIQNIRERDAAVMMGVSPTNPVAMYATSGLEKLVKFVSEGDIFERYRDSYRNQKVGGWVRCRSCGNTWRYATHEAFASMISVIRSHSCASRNGGAFSHAQDAGLEGEDNHGHATAVR